MTSVFGSPFKYSSFLQKVVFYWIYDFQKCFIQKGRTLSNPSIILCMVGDGHLVVLVESQSQHQIFGISLGEGLVFYTICFDKDVDVDATTSSDFECPFGVFREACRLPTVHCRCHPSLPIRHNRRMFRMWSY